MTGNDGRADKKIAYIQTVGYTYLYIYTMFMYRYITFTEVKEEDKA